MLEISGLSTSRDLELNTVSTSREQPADGDSVKGLVGDLGRKGSIPWSVREEQELSFRSRRKTSILGGAHKSRRSRGPQVSCVGTFPSVFLQTTPDTRLGRYG